jgi:hypothetical protein
MSAASARTVVLPAPIVPVMRSKFRDRSVAAQRSTMISQRGWIAISTGAVCFRERICLFLPHRTHGHFVCYASSRFRAKNVKTAALSGAP